VKESESSLHLSRINLIVITLRLKCVLQRC
jgi:hypothetical protein